MITYTKKKKKKKKIQNFKEHTFSHPIDYSTPTVLFIKKKEEKIETRYSIYFTVRVWLSFLILCFLKKCVMKLDFLKKLSVW